MWSSNSHVEMAQKHWGQGGTTLIGLFNKFLCGLSSIKMVFWICTPCIRFKTTHKSLNQIGIDSWQIKCPCTWRPRNALERMWVDTFMVWKFYTKIFRHAFHEIIPFVALTTSPKNNNKMLKLIIQKFFDTEQYMIMGSEIILPTPRGLEVVLNKTQIKLSIIKYFWIIGMGENLRSRLPMAISVIECLHINCTWMKCMRPILYNY